MQVKRFAECSAILSTFIKLPFVFKTIRGFVYFWVVAYYWFYCISMYEEKFYQLHMAQRQLL